MAAHSVGPSAAPTSVGAQAQRTQSLATALRAAARLGRRADGRRHLSGVRGGSGRRIDRCGGSPARRGRLRLGAGGARRRAGRAARGSSDAARRRAATDRLRPPRSPSAPRRACDCCPWSSRSSVHGVLVVGSATAGRPRLRRDPRERSPAQLARAARSRATRRGARAAARGRGRARRPGQGRGAAQALRGAVRAGHRAAAQQREAREDREAQERLHREDVARAAHAAQQHHRDDHRGAHRRERRALGVREDEPAPGAGRRHGVPAHAPEHPRPVAHQAARAARRDPGHELPGDGRRGDLQRPGHDREEAAQRHPALPAAVPEDPFGSREARSDRLPAARQRGALHAERRRSRSRRRSRTGSCCAA